MDESKRKIIGQRVLEERKKLGLTRAELYRRTGVAPQTLLDIESGTTDYFVRTLFRLCKGLGVSLSYILSGDKNFAESGEDD